MSSSSSSSSSKRNRQGQGGSTGGRRALGNPAGGAVAVAVSAALGGMMAQSAQAKGRIKVENVARGQARFETRGPNTQITVSDRAIINYRQFDVGRGEGVRFVQPSASSRVLNRINSAEPSHIDGRMSANGIVYFVNPSGVMFGRDAVVNVGRLYAAAANISDGDFMAGINRFVGGVGAVVNAGTIHADAVTLVGHRVINQGEILSQTAITMVAGDDVLVGERDGNLFVKVDTVQGLSSPTGNTASGKGHALRMGAGDLFSMAVYNEGKVRAKQITAQSGAGGATVVSGTLDASSSKAGETGGTVKVLGDKVAVAGATIDASGPAGGGTVLVGGDFQGKGAVPTASRTVVTGDSTIKADATRNGAGGKVVVWADDTTSFAGKISARGGAAGGDGGNVEVSGKQTLNFTGSVDTTAPAGKTGSLLLDPDSIVIGTDGTDDGEVTLDSLINAADGTGTFHISVTALQGLGDTTDVKLLANKTISAPGVNSIDFTLATKALTLQTTTGDISLGGTTVSTQGGAVTISAGGKADVGGIKSVGGTITVTGGTGVSAGAASLANVIDAGAGAVTLSATAGDLNVGNVTGGVVNLSAAAGKVLPVNGAVVTATGTAVNATGLQVGTAAAPLTVDSTSANVIVTAAGAAHFGTVQDLTVSAAVAGQVTLTSGTQMHLVNYGAASDLTVASGGNLDAAATLAGSITGGAVALKAGASGSIGGTAAVPVHATGAVSATAGKDVNLVDPTGDMTLGKIHADGKVTLNVPVGGILTPAGSLVDGKTVDVTASGKIGTGATLPLGVSTTGGGTVTAGLDLHVSFLVDGAATVTALPDQGSLAQATVDFAGQTHTLTYGNASDLTLKTLGDINGGGTLALKANALTLEVNDPAHLDKGAIGRSSGLNIAANELTATAPEGVSVVDTTAGLTTHAITASAGPVSVVVKKGDLTLTEDVSGSSVVLSAGHDILNGGVVGKRVSGSSVSMEAGTDSGEADGKIGKDTSPILTAATTLSLKSDRGSDDANSGVNASDTDGVDLTANAGGKVNVSTVGSGDLVVVNATGGSVALTAKAGSVLAKTSTSTVTASGTAAKVVDITASKDVGKLDDPANPSAGGLLNVDAVGGLVSISGDSVYLSNVATGKPGNIELTAPTPPATVGFDRDAAQAYALNVTNNLTLETKGWIRDSAVQQLSLGNTVDLRSKTDGIGQSGTPILTAAKAIRAAAHGSGGVFITDKGTGTVEVKNVTTQGQRIELTSSAGSLKLTGNVNAGTADPADVVLDAWTDVTGAPGHHVTGDDVTITAGKSGTGSIGATGAPADAIQVDAKTLTLTAAHTAGTNPGLINVNAKGPTGAALTLVSALTTDGPITVTTDGDLKVTHVATSKTASTGAVTLTSTAGAISDGGDTDPDVVGNKLTLVAKSGIGAGNALEIGAQIIGGAGNETQTTSGGIALKNDASGLIPPLPVGTSTQVWLKAGSGDVTLTQVGGVALTVNRATTADNVSIDNTGAITLAGDVTAGTDKNAGVTAGNVVTRTGGTVTAKHVELTAGNGAGGGDLGIGAPTARVVTKAKELVLKSSDGGDIYVTNSEPGQVSLTASTDVSGTLGSGNIVVSTDGVGGLNVVNVVTSQTAAPNKGRVSLQASAGPITDDTTGAPSISAKDLSLDATAIGAGTTNPLDTSVLNLAGVASAPGTGAITVRNTAASLTVGALPGVDDVTPVTITGLKTADSTIDLTQTLGTLTLEQQVDAGNGQVFLRAVQKDTGTLVNKAPITGTPKPPAPGTEVAGVTLIADNMKIAAGPGAKVQAGTSGANIVIGPATDRRLIVLGPTADAPGNTLYLGNAEFATLNTGGRVEVGSDAAGSITFTGPSNPPLIPPGQDDTVPIVLPHASTLSLVTGGSVTQTQSTATAFEGEKLSIQAGTGVGTATQRLVVEVGQLAATSEEGGVRVLNQRDLEVTDVGVVSGVRSGKLADITPTIDGDVDILSTKTLTITQMINATGSVHLKADNSLAGNDVIVNNQVVAGAGPNAHADASLTIEANRDIDINKNVAALMDVNMTAATRDVNVHDAVTAERGTVEIDAHHAVLSDLAGDIQAGTAVTVTSHTGGIDLNRPVRAAKHGIGVSAGDSGFGNSDNDIHTGKDAHLSGGEGVTLTAQDAINTAGKIDAGQPGGLGALGHVTMTAVAGGVLIENAVTASNGGDITVNANQDIRTRKDIPNLLDSPLIADGNVTLTSSGGTITTEAFVRSGAGPGFGSISAFAPLGSVNENGGWSASGAAGAVAGGDVWFGGGVGAGDFILGRAGVDVLSSPFGKLDAGSFVKLTALFGEVNLKAPVTAGEAFPFSNGSIEASGRTGVTTAAGAPLRAPTYVTLTSETGSIVTHDRVITHDGLKADGADITATANVDVTVDGQWSAGGSITGTATTGNVTSSLLGDLLANTFVDLTAGRGVSLLGTVTASSDHVQITAGTFAPPAGSVTTSDAVTAGSFVHMTAPDDVSILASATAGTDIAAHAGADVLTKGTLQAGTFIDLNAGQNVEVDNTATAKGDYVSALAQKGNILTGTVAAIAAETSVTLNAPLGKIDVNAPVTANKRFIQAAASGDITTADTAPLKANTFVHLLSNNGSVLSHGGVTATLKEIQVDAPSTATGTGDVLVDAPWTAGTDVTANAGHDVTSTLKGTIFAGHAVALDAKNDVSLSAAATADSDAITATAGHDVITFEKGDLTAGTFIRLDAGNDISLAGDGKARSQFIQATATNDVTTTTGQLTGHTYVDLHAVNGLIDLGAPVTAETQYVQAVAKGDVTSEKTAPVLADTSVLLDSSTGNVVTHATVTATHSDLTANAKVDVKVDAPWSAGNDALATAGNDVSSTTLGTITGNRRVILLAGNDVTLDAFATATADYLKATATAGDITTDLGGKLTAGSFVDLQALAGAITLAAPVTANGDYVQALAKRDITSALTAPIQAASHVLLVSSDGSVVGHGSVTAKGDDIKASAAVDILADAAWSAGHDILGTAGRDITSTPKGPMTAMRNIDLTASNDITLNGNATAQMGHILGTAGHDILTSGQLTAGAEVTLDAGHSITSGTNRVTAGADITYHAHTGDIATLAGALLSAGNDVLLTADHGRIDLRDDVTGHRDVTAVAQNDITTFPGAPVTATNRNVTLTTTGGSILTQDLVKAGADLDASAKGNITLTGGWQSGGNTTADAGGDINVRSTASYGAAGLFNAGNDVAFTSTGALVKGGGTGDTKVIAGNNIGMAAGSFVDGGRAQVTGQAGHDIQLALVKTTYPGTNPDGDAAAVTLVAGTKGGGTITDLHTFSDGSGAVGAPGVVAAGLDATAPNEIKLGTQLGWVRARSQSSGPLTLNEVDGVHVVEATTQSGLVTITSGDTMVVRDVVAGGANAALRAYHNDIVIEPTSGHQGSVTADKHQVTLTAASSIVGNTSWRNVKSADLDATAGAAITLGTDVDNITSTSGGKTTLHDFGSVTLTKVTTSGGDVDAIAQDALNVNTVIAGSGGGKNVHLQAVTGDITKDGPGINVQSDRLDAEAGGGIDLKTRVATIHSFSNANTTFDEQDGVTLELVKSDHGNISVTGGGAMTVQQVAGPVTPGVSHQVNLTSRDAGITGAGGNTNVVGDHLTTVAKDAIVLTTAVDSLTSSSGGDATFHEKDDVAIDTIDAAGRKVTLDAGGFIGDGNGADVNVTTGTLVVDARGVNLDTAVDHLSIGVTPGAFDGNRTDVAIRERDDVTVDRLTFDAPGNLDLSGGGNTSINIPVIDTRGGNQHYTGALLLTDTNPERNFSLIGHNILLQATLDSNSPTEGYNVTIDSSGRTTFLRPVGATGRLATLTTDAGGATTIKTQVHTAGAMVFNDPTSLGGPGATLDSGKVKQRRKSPALQFNDTVTLGGTGAVLQTAGGGVRFAGDVVDSSGDAKISSNTGYVDFVKGIRDSATLLLTIDATDGKPVKYESPTFGDVSIAGDVSVGSLTIHGGNVTVGNITATKGEDQRGGDILLAADPRIVFLKATARPPTSVQPSPVDYAAPKGLLTLKGSLDAASGSVTLGDPKADRLELGKPLLGPKDSLGKLIPAVATIVAYKGDLANAQPIDLVISSGSFMMGTWDKMTVLGGVSIHAAGTATLSDIAALKSINVEAKEIDIQFRDPSALLNDTGVLGTTKPDFGVDFFANEGITFNRQPRFAKARVKGQSVEFGVSSGFADKASVPGFTFRLRSDKAEQDKFLFKQDGVTVTAVLDATADGPSSTSISGTLTQALPQETPKPTEDTNLSKASRDQLWAMGIYARNASEQEMVDRVSGRVVYLDVPPNGIVPKPEDYTVVAGKLPQDVTDNLIQYDDKLVNVASKDADKAKLAKEVQAALSEAKAKFIAGLEKGQSFDPAAFREFVAKGGYPQADAVLGQFHDVLRQVQRMGLTQKQWSVYRQRLVSRIKPLNFGPDEMYDVIKAEIPEDRTLGMVSPVQGR